QFRKLLKDAVAHQTDEPGLEMVRVLAAKLHVGCRPADADRRALQAGGWADMEADPQVVADSRLPDREELVVAPGNHRRSQRQVYLHHAWVRPDPVDLSGGE